jgi:hypothetical protein
MRAACFLFVFAIALPASAQEASDTGTAPARAGGDSPVLPGALVVGGEVGAIFPQPFTGLDSHLEFGIELGYRLPFAGQRVEIMADVGYSPPGNSFTDKRDEGDYEGKLRQKELHFSLGPRIRVMDRSSPWNVTITPGARLFFLETTSNGSRKEEKFAEFTEQSTQFGFFVALGGEYVLGPGAAFLDVDLGWSKLPHTISGDVSTGNITTTLGYRLFLL